MDGWNKLAEEIVITVLMDPKSLTGASSDFGRVVVRRPQVVVRPAPRDVSRGRCSFAARHSLSIGIRGEGHSQSGQSLSEQIVIDMTALDQVRRVDDASATVGGGMIWRKRSSSTSPRCGFGRLSSPTISM